MLLDPKLSADSTSGRLSPTKQPCSPGIGAMNAGSLATRPPPCSNLWPCESLVVPCVALVFVSLSQIVDLFTWEGRQ